MAETKKKNVHQRVLAVIQDCSPVVKDLHVEFGKQKYNATSYHQVLLSVREAMVKHGIVIYPIHGEISQLGDSLCQIQGVFRIQNADDKEDYIDTMSWGHGQDYQDKGPGKALTYAHKILLLKTFLIPSDDDPDNQKNFANKGDKKTPAKKVEPKATEEKKPRAATKTELTKIGKALEGCENKAAVKKLWASIPKHIAMDDPVIELFTQRTNELS